MGIRVGEGRVDALCRPVQPLMSLAHTLPSVRDTDATCPPAAARFLSLTVGQRAVQHARRHPGVAVQHQPGLHVPHRHHHLRPGHQVGQLDGSNSASGVVVAHSSSSSRVCSPNTPPAPDPPPFSSCPLSLSQASRLPARGAGGAGHVQPARAVLVREGEAAAVTAH